MISGKLQRRAGKLLRAIGKIVVGEGCCCGCTLCPPDLASAYLVSGTLTTTQTFSPGTADFSTSASGAGEPCSWGGAFSALGSGWPFTLTRVRPDDYPWVPCCGWAIFFEPNFFDGFGVAFKCGDSPVGAYSDISRDSTNSPAYLFPGETVTFTGLTVS